MKLVHSRPANIAREPGKAAGAYADQPADVLAGILESADDLFAAVDQNLRFVVFNATFHREFTSIVGRAPKPGQDLLEALAAFPEQQAAADLVRRAFAGETLMLDQELTVPGAKIKVFEISLTPVLNTIGKPVVVAVVARDITEKRDAELKFRRLVEACPDAMLIVRGEMSQKSSASVSTSRSARKSKDKFASPVSIIR